MPRYLAGTAGFTRERGSRLAHSRGVGGPGRRTARVSSDGSSGSERSTAVPWSALSTVTERSSSRPSASSELARCTGRARLDWSVRDPCVGPDPGELRRGSLPIRVGCGNRMNGVGSRDRCPWTRWPRSRRDTDRVFRLHRWTAISRHFERLVAPSAPARHPGDVA